MRVNLEEKTSKLFMMDEETWMRHANPWSGWTRFTSLPLIYLAVWSRKWLKWFALLPMALVALWVWLNPRLFEKPSSTDNWMSKVTFGERVMANREDVPVPEHHLPVLKATRLVTSAGMLLSIYGLAKYEKWPTAFGMALTMLGKTWYMDRMVWLYEEMKGADPEYASWLF